MKNRLFKTFYGATIDLSKIVSISDAKFNNEEYYLNTYFEIYFQLLDKPFIYEKRLFVEGNDNHYETDECSFDWQDGNCYTKQTPKMKNGKYVACINLQKHIDKLIKVWQQYVGECD